MSLAAQLTAAFSQLGLAGVFVSMFIENIGIPLPTELGYLAALALIRRAAVSLPFVLIVLTLGHVTGSCLAYAIGRWGGGWLHGRFAGHSRAAAAHARLTRWYEQHGAITIFVVRFVGYIRPWASFVAGFIEFPFWTFLALTAAGSLLFNLIALSSSWLIVLAWQHYARYHLFIGFIGGCLFFGAVLYEIIIHRRRRVSTNPKS